MILRSLALRHGRRAAFPIARGSARLLSTEQPPRHGLEPEEFEALVQAAEINQVASVSALGSKASDSNPLPNAQPPAAKAQQPLQPHQKYQELRRYQKATSSIGSVVERRYIPDELVANPPSPKDISLELLMASQTHMGHHKSLWNPSNARYIYGVRQGIHIISLETTAAHLRRAARVVEEVAYRGGLILFVGTRRGHMEIVTKAAQLSKACHLFTKWIPGSITNRDIILSSREIRVVDQDDKDLPGFDTHIRDRRPLVPDLVVCMNPLENYTLLYECGLAGIPTIGVIDTNADPTWVTYTIPANDDSLRSIALIGGVLGRAGEMGQKRRLADAANGVVQWATPTETQAFMNASLNEFEREQEKWRRDESTSVSGKSGEEQLLDMIEVQRSLAASAFDDVEGIDEGYPHLPN